MKNLFKHFLFSAFVFLLIIIAISCIGCGSLLYYVAGHYTGYIKGNIKVVGTRIGNRDDAVFYSIRIRCNKIPFNPNVDNFTIKFSNGRILSSKDFFYSLISSIPNSKQWVSERKNKEGWGGEIKGFFVDGYMFEFRNKKLLYFSTREYVEGKKFITMIGTKDGKQFYKFPVTQKQLESILGKPDRYDNPQNYH